MADIVSPSIRSQMMSGIRGKNTQPELLIRKALHSRGYRYRLHAKELPGNPDIVLPRYKTVIFVNGCFWHGHGCHLFKWPKSNVEFWQNKIKRNIEVDQQAQVRLLESGWRVFTIWECALKGKYRHPLQDVADEIVGWLHGSAISGKITGKSEEDVIYCHRPSHCRPDSK